MIGEGVINSNNHGFPNIIEIEKEKSSSRAQNFFHLTISPFGTFRTIL